MAKFQRFDSRNKKRSKDKFRSEQRDVKMHRDEKSARNNYNRQHLTQAYHNGRSEAFEDSIG